MPFTLDAITGQSRVQFSGAEKEPVNSARPVSVGGTMVGDTGLEPVTSCMSSRQRGIGPNGFMLFYLGFTWSCGNGRPVVIGSDWFQLVGLGTI